MGGVVYVGEERKCFFCHHVHLCLHLHLQGEVAGPGAASASELKVTDHSTAPKPFGHQEGKLDHPPPHPHPRAPLSSQGGSQLCCQH